MGEKSEAFAGPEWEAFRESVIEGMVPKLQSSVLSMSLAPDGEDTDVKFAVELGFSIMLGKPIVVLLTPGRTLAPGLRKVADKVIEVDLDDPASKRDMSLQLTAFMKDRGLM